MFKSFEVFQKFSTEQMEAAALSVTAFSNGVQQLLAEASELSKKTVETGTDAFQSLLASKSMDRAVQVQMDYVKSACDSMLAGSNKITDILSTTAKDVFKPIEGAFHTMQDTAQTTASA